ncbi:interferon lambda receptor 1 isoform X2 [Morone saxatilis]|uniref:interferon lambda receptor 1 isoform X2 n=1 Tax=Morone saxatilis TaxID=34816 RepID=UPI0015E21060|nr:interferon lambda receptor 1 isoform X2 [Morone saxatilis]
MKMWSMKVIILLLFCYASLSTGNRKVYFVSKNFNNVLHWDAVESGANVTYSVQYLSDAKEQPFQIKKECQNITALSCDLTAETPSAHDVNYYAQVFVNGSIHGKTIRFNPLADTILGPPILSTYATVSSLHVDATLPVGPNGVAIEDIINKSKHGPSTTVVVYTLKITQPKWAAQHNESTTGRFVINLKNSQTEYCGYVVYKPFSRWGRSESEKATFCATLPGDPLMLLPWILISGALLVAIVIMSALCICNYVKGGKEKSMPQPLVPTSSTSLGVLQPLDGNLIISKPVFCTQDDHQTVYAKIQMKPNAPSVGVGGYSPQDIPCQAWQGSTGSSVGTDTHSLTANAEDTSAQSSEIYSVVAVHVPVVQKYFQQAITKDKETCNLPLSSSGKSWDEGAISPKLTLLQPLQDVDHCDSNPDRPLLLRTVRDPNGQLMLPLLTSQLENDTGDTQTDRIDSKRERPSLASLQSLDGSEWSDSGCDDSTLNTPTHPYCNTHYSPTQPVVPDFDKGCQIPSSDAIFESGYKQNWMPEILLGTASKDSCEYRRTNYPWTWSGPKKEEDDDRGGEESSREILLGSWVVKIQE